MSNKDRIKLQDSGTSGTSGNTETTQDALGTPSEQGVIEYTSTLPTYTPLTAQIGTTPGFISQYEIGGAEPYSQASDEYGLPYESKTSSLFEERSGDPRENFYLHKDIDDWSKFTPYLKQQGAPIKGINHRLRRAEAQGFWEQAGRAFDQTALGIGFGLVENVGYLGTMLYNPNHDYENALTKWAQKGREGVTERNEIYRLRPNKTIDTADSAWWFQHGQGLVESVAEFGITALIPGGIFGKIGGKVAQALAKTAKVHKGISTVIGAVPTAASLAYVEGAMSGTRVFDQTYNYQRKHGNSHDHAVKMAAEAASHTVRVNTMVNTVLNLTSIYPLFRGKTKFLDKTTKQQLQQGGNRFLNETRKAKRAARKAAKADLKKGIAPAVKKAVGKESIKEAAERISKVTFNPSRKDFAIMAGVEAVQEGAEELTNLVAEKSGMRIGQKSAEEFEQYAIDRESKNLLAKFVDFQEIGNPIDDIWNDEGLLNFALGAFGGVGQKIFMENVGNPFKKIEARHKGDKPLTIKGQGGEDILVQPGEVILDAEGNPTYEKNIFGFSSISARKAKKISDQILFNKTKLQIVNDLNQIDTTLNELVAISENKDNIYSTQEEIDLAYNLKKEELFNLNMYQSFLNGSGDNLIATFEEILNTDNVEVIGKKVDKEIAEVTKKLEAVQADTEVEAEKQKVEVEKYTNQLKELNSIKESQMTQAMLLGVAKNEKDNDYKAKAQEAIDTIKFMSKEYDKIMNRFDFGEGESHEHAKHLFRIRGYAHTQGKVLKKQLELLEQYEKELVAKRKELKGDTHAGLDEAIKLTSKQTALSKEIILLELGEDLTGQDFISYMNTLRQLYPAIAKNTKATDSKIDAALEDKQKEFLKKRKKELIGEKGVIDKRKKEITDLYLQDFLEKKEDGSSVDLTNASAEQLKEAQAKVDTYISDVITGTQANFQKEYAKILRTQGMIKMAEDAYAELSSTRGLKAFVTASKKYRKAMAEKMQEHLKADLEEAKAEAEAQVEEEAKVKAEEEKKKKEEEAAKKENDVIIETLERAIIPKEANTLKEFFNYLKQFGLSDETKEALKVLEGKFISAAQADNNEEIIKRLKAEKAAILKDNKPTGKITLQQFKEELVKFKSKAGDSVLASLEEYESLIDTLIKLGKNNSDPVFIEIVAISPGKKRLLADIKKKEEQIAKEKDVVNLEKFNKELAKLKEREEEDMPAYFNANNNTIGIVFNESGQKQAAYNFHYFKESFVHESIHGLLKNVLKDDNVKWDALTLDLENLLLSLGEGANLNEVLDNLIKQLEKDLAQTINEGNVEKATLLRDAYLSLEYIKNLLTTDTKQNALEELITQAYTRPGFAAWLNSIPSDEVKFEETLYKVSLWERIKNLILSYVEDIIGKSKLQELSNIMDKHVGLFLPMPGNYVEVKPGPYSFKGEDIVVTGIRGNIVEFYVGKEITTAYAGKDGPAMKYLTIEQFVKSLHNGSILPLSEDVKENILANIKTATKPEQIKDIETQIQNSGLTGQDIIDLEKALAAKRKEIAKEEETGVVQQIKNQIENVKQIEELAGDVLANINKVTNAQHRAILFIALHEKINSFLEEDISNGVKIVDLATFMEDAFSEEEYANINGILQRELNRHLKEFSDAVSQEGLSLKELMGLRNNFKEKILIPYGIALKEPTAINKLKFKEGKDLNEQEKVYKKVGNANFNFYEGLLKEANSVFLANYNIVTEEVLKQEQEVEDSFEAKLEQLETIKAELLAELKEFSDENIKGMAKKPSKLEKELLAKLKDIEAQIQKLVKEHVITKTELQREKRRQYRDARDEEKTRPLRRLVQLTKFKEGKEIFIATKGDKFKNEMFDVLYEVIEENDDHFVLLREDFYELADAANKNESEGYIKVPKEDIYDFQTSRSLNKNQRENLWNDDFLYRLFMHKTDLILGALGEDYLNLIVEELANKIEESKGKENQNVILEDLRKDFIENWGKKTRKIPNKVFNELKDFILAEDYDASKLPAKIKELVETLKDLEVTSKVKTNTSKVISTILWKLKKEGKSIADFIKIELRKDISINKNKQLFDRLNKGKGVTVKDKLTHGLLHANNTKRGANKDGSIDDYIAIHNWMDVDVAIYINTSTEEKPDWYYIGNPQNPNIYYKISENENKEELYHPGIMLQAYEDATTATEKTNILAEFTRLYSDSSQKRLLLADLKKFGAIANQQAELMSAFKDIYDKVSGEKIAINPKELQTLLNYTPTGGSLNFKQTREEDKLTAADLFLKEDKSIKESMEKFLLENKKGEKVLLILDNKVHYDTNNKNLEAGAFFGLKNIKNIVNSEGKKLIDLITADELRYKKNRYWALVQDVTGAVRAIALKPRNANKEEVGLFLTAFNNYLAEINERLALGEEVRELGVYEAVNNMLTDHGIFFKFGSEGGSRRVNASLELVYDKTKIADKITAKDFVIYISDAATKGKDYNHRVRNLDFTNVNTLEATLKAQTNKEGGHIYSLNNLGASLPKVTQGITGKALKGLLEKLTTNVKEDIFKDGSLLMRMKDGIEPAALDKLIETIKLENDKLESTDPLENKEEEIKKEWEEKLYKADKPKRKAIERIEAITGTTLKLSGSKVTEGNAVSLLNEIYKMRKQGGLTEKESRALDRIENNAAFLGYRVGENLLGKEYDDRRTLDVQNFTEGSSDTSNKTIVNVNKPQVDKNGVLEQRALVDVLLNATEEEIDKAVNKSKEDSIQLKKDKINAEYQAKLGTIEEQVNFITAQLENNNLEDALEILNKQGLVHENNNATLVDLAGGRDAITFNINGVPLPIYRSSKGTSSKTKGKWYPYFFNTDDWVAKGVSPNYKEGYDNKIIKQVLDALNSNHLYDSSIATVQQNKKEHLDLFKFSEDYLENINFNFDNFTGDSSNFELIAAIFKKWQEKLGPLVVEEEGTINRMENNWIEAQEKSYADGKMDFNTKEGNIEIISRLWERVRKAFKVLKQEGKKEKKVEDRLHKKDDTTIYNHIKKNKVTLGFTAENSNKDKVQIWKDIRNETIDSLKKEGKIPMHVATKLQNSNWENMSNLEIINDIFNKLDIKKTKDKIKTTFKVIEDTLEYSTSNEDIEGVDIISDTTKPMSKEHKVILNEKLVESFKNSMFPSRAEWVENDHLKVLDALARDYQADQRLKPNLIFDLLLRTYILSENVVGNKAEKDNAIISILKELKYSDAIIKEVIAKKDIVNSIKYSSLENAEEILEEEDLDGVVQTYLLVDAFSHYTNNYFDLISRVDFKGFDLSEAKEYIDYIFEKDKLIFKYLTGETLNEENLVLTYDEDKVKVSTKDAKDTFTLLDNVEEVLENEVVLSNVDEIVKKGTTTDTATLLGSIKEGLSAKVIPAGYAPLKLQNVSDENVSITNADVLNDILVSKDGNSIFAAMNARIFVLANVNGVIIPFYRSSEGTSGKIKGDWYPFFGFTSGQWLVKGHVNKDTGFMSYSPSIDAVTKILNKNFKILTTDISTSGRFIDKKFNNIPGNINDYGLTLYTPLDRFGEVARYTKSENLYDKELGKSVPADSKFVAELTGLYPVDIHMATRYEWINDIINKVEQKETDTKIIPLVPPTSKVTPKITPEKAVADSLQKIFEDIIKQGKLITGTYGGKLEFTKNDGQLKNILKSGAHFTVIENRIKEALSNAGVKNPNILDIAIFGKSKTGFALTKQMLAGDPYMSMKKANEIGGLYIGETTTPIFTQHREGNKIRIYFNQTSTNIKGVGGRTGNYFGVMIELDLNSLKAEDVKVETLATKTINTLTTQTNRNSVSDKFNSFITMLSNIHNNKILYADGYRKNGETEIDPSLFDPMIEFIQEIVTYKNKYTPKVIDVLNKHEEVFEIKEVVEIVNKISGSIKGQQSLTLSKKALNKIRELTRGCPK
jgi:hypothetical protein